MWEVSISPKSRIKAEGAFLYSGTVGIAQHLWFMYNTVNCEWQRTFFRLSISVKENYISHRRKLSFTSWLMELNTHKTKQTSSLFCWFSVTGFWIWVQKVEHTSAVFITDSNEGTFSKWEGTGWNINWLMHWTEKQNRSKCSLSFYCEIRTVYDGTLFRSTVFATGNIDVLMCSVCNSSSCISHMLLHSLLGESITFVFNNRFCPKPNKNKW